MITLGNGLRVLIQRSSWHLVWTSTCVKNWFDSAQKTAISVRQETKNIDLSSMAKYGKYNQIHVSRDVLFIYLLPVLVMKITFEIVFWGSLLDLAPNSSIPTSISLTFFRFFLWQNSSYIDVSKDLKVQFRVTRYEKDMKGSYLVHTWLVFGSYSHLFWSFDPSPSLHQGCIAHASGLGIHIISTWGKNRSMTSDPTTRPQSSMLVVLSNVANRPATETSDTGATCRQNRTYTCVLHAQIHTCDGWQLQPKGELIFSDIWSRVSTISTSNWKINVVQFPHVLLQATPRKEWQGERCKWPRATVADGVVCSRRWRLRSSWENGNKICTEEIIWKLLCARTSSEFLTCHSRQLHDPNRKLSLFSMCRENKLKNIQKTAILAHPTRNALKCGNTLLLKGTTKKYVFFSNFVDFSTFFNCKLGLCCHLSDFPQVASPKAWNQIWARTCKHVWWSES